MNFTGFFSNYPLQEWPQMQCDMKQLNLDRPVERRKKHLSNEKNPGCLGCIGDYTTQLYGDFNKPV